MTPRRVLAAVALLLLAGVIAAIVLRKEPPATASRPLPEARTPAAPTAAAPQAPPPAAEPSPPTPYLEPSRTRTATLAPGGIVRLAPGASESTGELNDPSRAPSHDIQVVHEILGSYRRIFGENPFGGLNSEITASLTGKNPKNLAVIPPDSANIDAEGQLVDRWGTPYFFHPVSREIMEVLSAGPDGKLWTQDDIHGE